MQLYNSEGIVVTLLINYAIVDYILQDNVATHSGGDVIFSDH